MNETLLSTDRNTTAPSLHANGSTPAVNGRRSSAFQDEPLIPRKPATPPPSAGINGKKSRVLADESIIRPKPEAEPAPAILDPELEDEDLRMTISVTVQGRSRKIVAAKFDRIVPDGARSQNRHVFFQTLASILDEMKQTVGIKTNAKLGFDAFPKAEKKTWNDNDVVGSDPGPMPQSLNIHDDPPV